MCAQYRLHIMKTNLPVTDTEIPFPLGEEIISTTDLKGIITSYNDTFLHMSGFEPEELLGKNHNVIRHPDIPPPAFADLWQNIKANKHWMGIVKNRSKNGDYYWVDAYVTPIVEKGEVTGYESVRVKPSAERVARADKIYKQLNDGKAPALGSFLDRLTLKSRSVLLNVLAVLSGAAAYSVSPEISVLPAVIGITSSIVIFHLGATWVFSPLQKALAIVHKDINNPLMALIYTGRSDEIGQIQLPAELLKAKLRTILGRIKDVAVKIENNADDSAKALTNINTSIQSQASETDLVATAMTEMTATVQEVARSAAQAAQKADEANQHSQEGVGHASGAAGGLQGLNQAVKNVAEVVSRLDTDAQNIGTVVDVIKSIAEQTNLLALNAAIEAARAGEQGRGFAVVADEVRTLAGRTQDSTEEIQQLIENLNSAVSTAVSVMDNSQQSAGESETEVSNAIGSLNSIAQQVSEMNDVNTQIATAVEQQSAVSEEINRNIVQINQSAEEVLFGVGDIGVAAESLAEQSHNLTDMIQRFKEA